MRVLLDHCVPRVFGAMLAGHEVWTAREMGWEGLRNGTLLQRAGAEVDALVTVDRHMMKQQNVGELAIAVIVLLAVSNKLRSLEPLVPDVLKLLGQKLEKRVYVVGPVQGF